jgi:hypothetical protein
MRALDQHRGPDEFLSERGIGEQLRQHAARTDPPRSRPHAFTQARDGVAVAGVDLKQPFGPIEHRQPVSVGQRAAQLVPIVLVRNWA